MQQGHITYEDLQKFIENAYPEKAVNISKVKPEDFITYIIWAAKNNHMEIAIRLLADSRFDIVPH